MAWTNLSILGVGAALVAIPVILHFLMQPKPKDMIFPAMRFLKERQLSNRSRLQIRHFLLLLMRCLLIGLVAVALAGPSVVSNEFGSWVTLFGIGVSGMIVGIVLLFSLFRNQRNWMLVGILSVLFIGHLIYATWAANKLLGSESAQLIGDDRAPVAALILIDTSPRMEYRHENNTRLEKAQEMGKWLVSQFPGDSQVCVCATDNDRPFFSVDIDAAERRLETLQTNYSGSSISKSLLQGLQILDNAPQERKEIYIITDMTRQSWQGENAKPIIRRLEKMVGSSLFVVDVGVENATNFGLTPLKLSDVEITGNGRLVVTTEIQRTGSAAQRTATMTVEKHEPPLPVVRDERTIFPEMTFDGQTVMKNIRENGSVQVKFTFSEPLDVGTYHGRIEIEGQDGLAIDDVGYFTIRVGEAKKALVVHPSNVNPRVINSLLAPQDKIDAQTARFECETITQTELQTRGDLEGYDVVYLLNPRPLGDTDWQRLEAFVQNGGGLGIFLGHNAVAGGSAHPSFSTTAAQRVLAGILEQPWFNEEPDLFLSPKELNHPIFNLIRSIETTVLWNRFPVFMHWGIGPDKNAEEFPTQVLLRFGNREPAVIERTIGSGRILIMTTPITEYGFVEDRPSWNSLLTGNPVPAFLLLDGMASYLVRSDTGSLNITVGQIAVFDNNLREYPEVYQVFSPQPEKPPNQLNAVEDKIRYRFVDHPGHYRLKGVFNRNVVLRGFSANLDTSASDLTRIEPDELDTVLGQDRYQLARRRDEIQRQQGTMRRGQEFYPLVILMMLVVLAVEYLMSNRFYRS